MNKMFISPTIIKKNIKKDKITAFLFGLFRFLFLIAFSYIILYPLFYMISTSLKSMSDFQDASIVWIPKNLTWENYKTALDVLNFKESLLVTIRLEIISAAIEVFSCAVPAYGLARYNFFGKKFLMFILILLILIPVQMIITPLMINFSRLYLLDTPWSFYLPSMFGVGIRAGIMIYIYYQFFRGLPGELEEAAWIDGSTPLRTFFKIALPSSSVVIFVVSVLSLVWHWNDYFVAVMYTSGEQPLAVALAAFNDNLTMLGIMAGFRNTATKMAACIFVIVPVLVIYLIVQRNFVKSIDRVGITG